MKETNKKVGQIAFIHPGITLEYNMGNMCVAVPRLDLTTSRLRVERSTI